jgi:hypothetical protein
VFRGPRLRRLTAEQFEDAISQVSGDWRVKVPQNATHAAYAREWALKSDPLSRALGRPIRDQVYTERNWEPTTLQALELMNGPLLSHRLERAAQALLGRLPQAPANLFDSKLMRTGSAAVDIEIAGANELHLLIEDVGSYDASRVIAGWSGAELIGPAGATALDTGGLIAGVPRAQVFSIAGRGYTRFRAVAEIDAASKKSDIGPAVRFFVFSEKPAPDRLVRIEGAPPAAGPPKTNWKPAELVDYLYTHLFARNPAAGESKSAIAMLGSMTPQTVEDLLWALLMSPEFQFIH